MNRLSISVSGPADPIDSNAVEAIGRGRPVGVDGDLPLVSDGQPCPLRVCFQDGWYGHIEAKGLCTVASGQKICPILPCAGQSRKWKVG